MAIVSRKEPNYVWSEKSQADWCSARDLLKQAQYELVAEFLGQKQRESEQTGNVLLADMLAAVRQICLACQQNQAGAEWFWQAYQEAGQRERELKQLLCTLLELVEEECILELSAKQAPVVTMPTGELNRSERDLHPLWRRIQRLLGWESTFHLPNPAVPALPTPVKTELPVNYPVRVELEQEKPSASTLFIYCLGIFRVYQNEKLIEKWLGHKSKSIFKYMLIHQDHPIHCEILMDVFWPDVDPEAARRNLHQAIYLLRQTLQTGSPDLPYVLSEDGGYRFNPELELWIDSEAFGRCYETGQQLERQGRMLEAVREYEMAESLYQGEFLVEDIYEDWSLMHRENLKHTHLDILDRLSQYYCAQEQFALCIAYCQKILQVDNCREDAHCCLMRCYLHQGQRHLALRQYHLCVEALARELEVSPMPATVELYCQICRNQTHFSEI